MSVRKSNIASQFQSQATSGNFYNETLTSTSVTSLQNKLLPAMVKYTNSFLDNSELSKLCNTARYFQLICSKDLAERKKVSEELLLHVFNADSKRVKEFFEQTQVSKKMVLTKTGFREKSKLRHWRAVSPLQGAALCGDNFLVCELLDHIIQNDTYRSTAIQQLREVVTRKEMPIINAPSLKAPVSSKKQLMEQFFSLIGLASTKEKKGASEQIHAKFADFSEYLAPAKRLLQTYDRYLKEIPSICRDLKKSKIAFDKHVSEIQKLQKVLPTYCLQELFYTVRGHVFLEEEKMILLSEKPQYFFSVVKSLCESTQIELEKIIHCLKTNESAQNLSFDFKNIRSQTRYKKLEFVEKGSDDPSEWIPNLN